MIRVILHLASPLFAATTAIAVTAALLLAGCNSGGSHTSNSPGSAIQGGGVPSDALAPDRIRIHPLTRFAVESDKSGAATRLTCHIELKDKYGHTAKSLGLLRIELYRPGNAPGGGGGADEAAAETQALVWEIDLTDPDENALIYDDLVTRTYVVHLGGLPDWLVHWSRGQGSEPWVTLKATFAAVLPSGGQKRLEATYRLMR